MEPWTPVLSVREFGHGCRLSLGGIAHADGTTLQQAADELVARVLDAAFALERNARFAPGLPPPDPRVLGFMHEIRRQAAGREDVRGLILRGRRDAG